MENVFEFDLFSGCTVLPGSICCGHIKAEMQTNVGERTASEKCRPYQPADCWCNSLFHCYSQQISLSMRCRIIIKLAYLGIFFEFHFWRLTFLPSAITFSLWHSLVPSSGDCLRNKLKSVWVMGWGCGSKPVAGKVFPLHVDRPMPVCHSSYQKLFLDGLRTSYA